MNMNKSQQTKQLTRGELIYEGKAKRIYHIPREKHLVWVEYKDDLTAFNAQKKGSFYGKGMVNCQISTIIFHHLSELGHKTHLVGEPSNFEQICRKLLIVPLEVVVRNRLAGSTAKKFGIVEGTALEKPLVEFYYKDDALNDPFVSDDQALMMKAAKDQKELEELKSHARKLNSDLVNIFSRIGIDLIDFKVEFGRAHTGELLLADEITPDTCRLWDIKTGERLDKDRFRRDLGGVREAYENVLERLKKRWS